MIMQYRLLVSEKIFTCHIGERLTFLWAIEDCFVVLWAYVTTFVVHWSLVFYTISHSREGSQWKIFDKDVIYTVVYIEYTVEPHY